jgi:cytochrome c biogenesis protein CcmG, thiol:disulfide interchange protein DsbE
MTEPIRSHADDTTPFPARSGEPAPTLADDDADPDRAEQGRIGYGRWGRLSPVGLALLILLTLGAIWAMDRDRADEIGGPPRSTASGELRDPRPAPDFEMATMNDSGMVTLEDLRGKTVVVNFWASWCTPCREEMPALQESADAHEGDVVFVGIGAKNDRQGEAEAFVEEFGITYPIGRDTEGGDNLSGAIEKAFGVPGYPATFFITPEGMINQIVFGPLETEALDTYIANAAD